MKARGWEERLLLDPAEPQRRGDHRRVLAEHWDCIVIGGGIRVPSKGLLLFERILNAIRRGAPETPIAFNTSPSNTAEAAVRWLD